jgi:hypothetical protein
MDPAFGPARTPIAADKSQRVEVRPMASKSPARRGNPGKSQRQMKELPHRGPTSLADYPHRSCERPSRNAAATQL